MPNSLKPGLLLVAGAVTMTALLTASPAASAKEAEPQVPAELQVPEGNSLFLVGHATGVQIYACTASTSGASWTLLAPRAALYGTTGRQIGTHYAGPTWEANDGSRVVGRKEAGVTVDPRAIPWLRLSAASTSAGPDGDRLARTTYIQRLNTTGGLAPVASECDPTAVGARAEVPYTADYYFWG